MTFGKKSKFTFAPSRLCGLALKSFLTALLFLTFFSNVFAQNKLPQRQENITARQNTAIRKDERIIVETRLTIVEDEYCDCVLYIDPIYETRIWMKILKVMAKPFTTMGKILK